jgi:hypothetical protein
MTEITLSEIQKELVDLKIRVNNLEKKVSKLTIPKTQKSKTTRFI